MHASRNKLNISELTKLGEPNFYFLIILIYRFKNIVIK
ncbi:hypothetical protein MPTP_1928 (plasmid) [Melissococcus plutonius ATCC 35311]|uniref:Uncharacterized protein n=2 Tax=Melissococcus plutonius TaxID=33970 RepID=F3YCU0_MELPT|nr:hypothetical protein MPTP_1928 [Melissococcus plutonius ATCC 35311]